MNKQQIGGWIVSIIVMLVAAFGVWTFFTGGLNRYTIDNGFHRLTLPIGFNFTSKSFGYDPIDTPSEWTYIYSLNMNAGDALTSLDQSFKAQGCTAAQPLDLTSVNFDRLTEYCSRENITVNVEIDKYINPNLAPLSPKLNASQIEFDVTHGKSH
jgi:hypothetical protein